MWAVCLITVLCAASVQCKTEITDKQAYFTKDMLTSEFAQSHLTRVWTSNSGRKVYVFDDVLPYALLVANRMFFSSNDNWRYVLFDKFVVDKKGKFDGGNGIPWKSWQNPTLFMTTRTGALMKSLVDFSSHNSTLSGENAGKNYQMSELYSSILRRGDHTQQYKDHSSEVGSVDGYSMVIYTNTLWLKNSYGEMLFYEDDDNMDIFGVASPRQGRIVIWDSAIPYLARPPSIAELAGQYMIFAQFNSEPKVVYEKRAYFFDFLENLKDSYFHKFVCTDNADKVGKVDLDKHLTLRRNNKAGDFVAVFDGLFKKEDLDELRTHTVKNGKYFYDDSLDLSSDNVQWIAGFHVDNFVKSRFWPVIKQMAEYVTGYDSWYPYDVACNLIRSADHTRFHLDTSSADEKETTFLLYLSPNWTAEDYGETAFMEYNYDSPDNDYVAEVVPMYGRAVIFSGNFPHSAHPPAPSYGGPRYTFAVKLSYTKREALIKTHHEESRHNYFGLQEQVRDIVSDPATFAARQKITTVTNFLVMRSVQQQLNYISLRDHDQPEQAEEEEEENETPQIEQKSQKVQQMSKPEQGEDDGDDSNGDSIEYEDTEYRSGMADLRQEDYDLLETVLGEETLEGLLDTPESVVQVVAMARHYGLDKLNSGDSEQVHMDFSSMVSNVTESSRDNVMLTWQRICGDDDNCLQAYVRLFLKQHFLLREQNIRALFSSI
uniref:Uncharacterized protein LOC100186758 n=1 Tax=Phallusia mammillata TaxID=59560 RepID=A0A6F9DJ65_9ASCI|nr:uncharacterized protein LOC100186758 [Phallusia mammillata]